MFARRPLLAVRRLPRESARAALAGHALAQRVMMRVLPASMRHSGGGTACQRSASDVQAPADAHLQEG